MASPLLGAKGFAALNVPKGKGAAPQRGGGRQPVPIPAQKGGGRQPAPTPIQKWAVVKATEDRVFPGEVVPSPRTGGKPLPVPLTKKARGKLTADPTKPTASLNRRFNWALGGLVDPAQHKAFVRTMAPADKAKKIAEGKATLRAAQTRGDPSAWRNGKLVHVGTPVPLNWWQQAKRSTAAHVVEGLGHAVTHPPTGHDVISAADRIASYLQVPTGEKSTGITRAVEQGVPARAVGLARTAQQAGVGLAHLANRDVGQPLVNALEAARQGGGVTPLSSRGLPAGLARQPIPVTRQESSILSPQIAEGLWNAAKALPKVAVGLAVSPVGIANHPLKAVDGLIGAIRGMGMLPATGVVTVKNIFDAISNPKLSGAQRLQLIHNQSYGLTKAVASMYEDWLRRLGPNATYGDVIRGSANNGLPYLMDGLTLLPAVGEVGAIGRLFMAGHTLGDSIRLVRDPALAETDTFLHRRTGEQIQPSYTPRTATITGRHVAEPVTVRLPESRSPTGRVVQKAYDAATGAIESAAGKRIGPKLWTSPTRRALRVYRQNNAREMRRMNATAHNLWHQVASYTGEHILGEGSETKRAQLFYNAQKPHDIPDEVWMRAIIDDAEGALRRGHPAHGRVSTATEKRLDAQLQRFRGQMDAASRDRWLNKIEDVHHESERLAASRMAILDTMKRWQNRLKEIEEDDSLSAADKARQGEYARGVLRQNQALLKATREQAEDLNPHHMGPVDSPMRTALSDKIDQLPRVSAEEKEAFLSFTDARARRWGEETGHDPGEWYSSPEGLGIQEIHLKHMAEEDLPAGAFAQTRELPTTPLEPPPDVARTNRNRAVHVRAHRNGEPTWEELQKDGTLKTRNTSEKQVGLKYANPPTNDIKGRPLFGQEVPYDVVVKRWEEGFDRAYRKSHPDAKGAEVKAARHDAMLHSASFYKELFPFFGRIFHDREVQAWLLSQKGASPARGLLDLQKVIARAMTRERIGSNDIGLAAQTMARVLYGQRGISEGVAAKLTDFTDVGHGQVDKRTWAGNDPAAGRPYVADRWEARGGPGLVDEPYLETLYREHDAALQKQGYVSRKEWQGMRDEANRKTREWMDERKSRGAKTTDNQKAAYRRGQIDQLESQWEKANPDRRLVKTDMKAGLGDVQYEHVSDYGNGLTDYLNKRGYLGRKDWTTDDAQALNWAGIQHSVGEVPENIDTALFAQEKPVSFEVEGVGRLAEQFPELQHLPVAERFAVTKYVADRAIDLAAHRSGAVVVRTDVGFGGWEGVLSPSVRVGVLAEGPVFGAFIDNLRDLFDEAEVWGMHSHSRAEYRQFVVEHAALQDHQLLLNVWNELREAHPEFMGFTQVPGGGLASVLMTEDGAPFAVTKAFQEGVNATLDSIAERHGTGEFNADFVAVDPVISSRTGSALRGQLERHLGQAKRGPELRRARQSASTAQKTLRVGDAERGAVAGEIQHALDILRTDGLEGLENQANLAGRIRDPLSRPPTERVTATGRLPGRVETYTDETGKEKTVSYVYPLDPRDPHAPTPPAFMAQTRLGDINGAVQFLNTTDGQRILYLTEHADVSTLLHEMFGHSVREMKTYYPEEWGKVEDFIGKPLEEWNVEDHERFARMAEQYFASGRAPLPELVPAFKRTKQSMKAIYGGQSVILRDNLPLPVRNLFDTYFGSYSDSSVYRVAAMSTRIADEMRGGEAHALFSFTDKELASLRKRNDTRAYNASLEGLGKKILRFQKLESERDLTEAEQLAYEKTKATWTNLKTQQEMSAVERETGLRKRIAQLEDALTLDANDPKYLGALDAMRGLVAIRENLAQTIFGDTHDAVFENRVDLLADYMVDQGLISEDYAKGTATYVKHRAIGQGATRLAKVPAQDLTRATVGKTSTSGLGFYNRNELLRWQHGDLYADPKVVLESYQAMSAFHFVYTLKEMLGQMARDLGPDEPIPDDAYLFNGKGSPVPNLQKGAQGPAGTAEVQEALDALESMDSAEIETVVAKYAQDSLNLDPAEIALLSRDARAKLGLKVLDKNVVNNLFRPLGGTWGKAGKALDLSNTIARWSLIYSNPSYVPINLIGNSFFVLAQQGPRAISNYIMAAKLAHSDPALVESIAAQAGELPAIAAIERGRTLNRVGRTLRQTEQVALRGYTKYADQFPRVVAWIYEAKRLGYHTAADMKNLIEGTSAKAIRHRDVIGQRADEIMVNFNRLSEYERQYFTRLLFIWPWIRGATAWPFYYAKEYPVTFGVAAAAGKQVDQHRQSVLGNVPIRYREMFPLSSAKNGYANVVNMSSISPTGQAADVLDSLRGLVTGSPDPSAQILDFLQPLVQTGIHEISGTDQYGRPTSRGQIAEQGALGLIPLESFIQGMADPGQTSQVFKDRSRGAQSLRKFVRLTPSTIDDVRLQGYALHGVKLSSSDKLKRSVSDLQAKAKKVGAEPPSRNVLQVLQMQQWLNDEHQRVINEIKQAGWHPTDPRQTTPTLSPLQQAWAAWRMYAHFLPYAQPAQPDPNGTAAELHAYTDALLYGSQSQPGAFYVLGQYRSGLKKMGG